MAYDSTGRVKSHGEYFPKKNWYFK